MPPKRDEKDESPCDNGKCNKHVKGGIQCEICNIWWHPGCAGMSTDLCECLGANQQLHWYCAKCNPGVGKIMQELRKTQDRLEVVEERKRNNAFERIQEQTEVASIIAKMEGELLLLRQDVLKQDSEVGILKDTINEISKRPTLEGLKLSEDWPLLSKQTFSKIAAQEVEKKLEHVSKDLHYLTQALRDNKKDVAEEKDKEDKKNNIIVYNIPEHAAGTVDEKMKLDKIFMLELMNALHTGVDEDDIKKLVRFL
jgi:hypothetical protein